jgi:hypothetical protein
MLSLLNCPCTVRERAPPRADQRGVAGRRHVANPRFATLRAGGAPQETRTIRGCAQHLYGPRVERADVPAQVSFTSKVPRASRPPLGEIYQGVLTRLNETPNEALRRFLHSHRSGVASLGYTIRRVRRDATFRDRLEIAAWTPVSHWRALVIGENASDGIAGLITFYPRQRWRQVEGRLVEMLLRSECRPVGRVHPRSEPLDADTEAILQLRALLLNRRHLRRVRSCNSCQVIFIVEGGSGYAEYCSEPACRTARDRKRKAEYRRPTS